MKKIIVLIAVMYALILPAQIKYGTPINDELPEKLDSLRRAISVNNFPKTIDPIKIDFKTKKQVMKQTQPYTWTNNWRTDDTLFGGWAMWYFIGITKDGETVCGYEKIETTNHLLN